MFAAAQDTLESNWLSKPPAPQPVPVQAPAKPLVLSPVPEMSDTNSSISSVPSTPTSLGHPSQLPQTSQRPPSPQYPQMSSGFTPLTPTLSSSQSSQQSPLLRLKSFLRQRREQDPNASQSSLASSLSLGKSVTNSQPAHLKSKRASSANILPETKPEIPIPSVMAKFYDPEAPCFTGRCLVRMSGDMSPVPVGELKRGMYVQTLMGPRKVAAILRTSISSGELLLCHLGALEITPWHPVMLSDAPMNNVHDLGTWLFPGNVIEPAVVQCDAVYSVLLEGEDGSGSCAAAHTISVSGVWCTTLGHGLVRSYEGDIRAHAFFGDYDKVVKEMSRLDGFFQKGGIVNCAGIRRGYDGMVCGFVGESVVRRDLFKNALTSMVYV
jgi:hypothetical protein